MSFQRLLLRKSNLLRYIPKKGHSSPILYTLTETRTLLSFYRYHISDFSLILNIQVDGGIFHMLIYVWKRYLKIWKFCDIISRKHFIVDIFYISETKNLLFFHTCHFLIISIQKILICLEFYKIRHSVVFSIRNFTIIIRND